MLRTGASRLALRSIATPATRPVSATFRQAAVQLPRTANFGSLGTRRPQIPSVVQWKPIQAAVLRRTLADKIDREAEKRYAEEAIKPTPERVTPTSSTQTMAATPVERVADNVDMTAGIKQDIHTIRDTFTLTEVPRQAYYIGLAGVLPYLATSLSTVYCAYEINHSVAGYGYLFSAQTAEAMLQVLEPLQIGYGAVILSFLGAIHWGLEWAGYGGYQGYRRYAIGVFAPAVAWPTVLMPVEYALISQFCAFTLLYYVDTQATYKGWTPPWYAIYRFVLTFVVGASIVVSLIGRGEVAGQVGKLPGAVDRIKELQESAQETLAKEEESIRAQQAAKEADSSEDLGKKSRT